MEDIEAVKLRLGSESIKQKIAALRELLKYGQEGLDLVIQALQNESWLLQHTAFLLLRQKSVRSIPQVKRALREYMIRDGQYPDERQEIKSILPNFTMFIEDEYGYPILNPALLPLMKWGEVIIDDRNATGYRNEGVYVYIVDCHSNDKIWKSLGFPEENEHGLEIDLKFLQKKGYSYYLREFLPLLEYFSSMHFPTLNQKETLIFYQNYELVNEDDLLTILEIYSKNNAFNNSSVGEVVQEQKNWFVVSEEFNLKKLSRVKDFFQIPKKYLLIRGYSYYRRISQVFQLPLLGYLSPKEYLDFLNFQILDFLSLKPIWSYS